jgi:hypothetical protein
MAPDFGLSPRHIRRRISRCVGGCNAGDGPKDKQDVALFISEALNPDRKPVGPKSF